MFRNFKMISYVVFGRGCFNQLESILAEKRSDSDSFMVFLVDDVFESSSLIQRIPLGSMDQIILVNVGDEPKTIYVDELTDKARNFQVACPMELSA